MAGTQVLSIRAIRCVACGDAERLITVTADAVISRCYVCGDVAVKGRGRDVEAATADRAAVRLGEWPARPPAVA